MFVIGIQKENVIIDINNKVLEDHVIKDFVQVSYHVGRRIVVTLVYDVTAIISHAYEEGGVLFCVLLDSDVMVSIR